MGVIGVAMLGVAVLSFYWQHYAKLGLLEFALQVMVFAYAGLLGVYFAAVLTPRGNSASVIASLIAGFVTVLLLQPGVPVPALHRYRCRVRDRYCAERTTRRKRPSRRGEFLTLPRL
jgi:hypothetical protein